MKTVKEISDLTGISVRTLHYYDEIGLLKPTGKSAAGYRLYDDKALEVLQQILFFREFDIPLKEIKAVMEDPSLDRDQILRMQRGMLEAKKARIARLIASIDGILKGENKMDFEIFNRSEIEALCQTTIDRMPDLLRQSILQEFGSIEQWRAHYIERAAKEDMQRGYQKLVEWYGDKGSALKAMTDPPSMEVAQACMKRVDAVLQKLIAHRDEPVDTFAVKEIVGEYGYLLKQLYQIKREDGLMLQVAASYEDERIRAGTDEKYGEGAAAFFKHAIESFYGKEQKNRI